MPIEKKFGSALRSAYRHINRRDPFIAIVLVESYFRPLWFRLIEYIVFVILFKLKLNKYMTLSIGMCQIRAIDWMDYFQVVGIEFSISNILRNSENIYSCASAVRWYFENRKKEKARTISGIYTGSYNIFYEKLIVITRNALDLPPIPLNGLKKAVG